MHCEHEGQIGDPAPATKGCPECEAAGQRWVALRECLSCGHVGCCDSSHGHARRHFEATGHPIIASLGDEHPWRYCYVHRDYVDA